MRLRPYQEEAYQAVIDAWADGQRCFVEMPTGTGKTIVFSKLAEHRVSHGRVMVTAHLRELVRQAQDKIKRSTGLAVDIEMGEERVADSMFQRSPVIAASRDTIVRNNRMARFSDVRTLIVDECHRAASAGYQKILDFYKESKIVGFTATPDRLDEKSVGRLFERCAFSYKINQAIEDAWLVPVECARVRVEEIELDDVRVTAGDLNAGDLARRLASDEKIVYKMVGGILEHAGPRKTIVFCPPGHVGDGLYSDKFSVKVTQLLNEAKPGSARRISADTPDAIRKQDLEDYRKGVFQYLVNVAVFTEGFDEPSIECVAVCRPTLSRALYTQMVGRGTRPLTGIVDNIERADDRHHAIAKSNKPRLLVLDFVGNSGKHSLVSPVDVFTVGEDEDVVREANKILREGGDVKKIVERARKQVQDRRAEMEARRRIEIKVKSELKYVNPFKIVGDKMPPIREWDRTKRPTAEQYAELEKHGIKPKDVENFGHATALLALAWQRRFNGQTSLKQANMLAKNGLDPNMSREQASVEISKLMERWKGWRGR